MKRIVAVGIIAVLACALFLVPYASAAGKLTIIDKWVEGPSGEVLDEYTYVDVNGDCTYNVKVGIEGTGFRPIFVTANLAFGPNYGNRNCQDDRTKKGEIGQGETTTTISFADISFLPLADCDEAFKEFADGKSGWKWDKCWYKFDVESTMCEGTETEIVCGIPNPSYDTFDDPHVEQNRTLKGMTFDYSIPVWANCEDCIELQVRNYTSGRWDKYGLQNYTELDVYTNKTLTWHAVNLTPDNFDSEGHGQYKFVGNTSESQPYSGPTIEEKFYDLRVTPTQGKNNVTFNYSVTVNANISDKIALEVKNHTTNHWDSKGTREYVTPNVNETLTWNNIQLNTHELSRLNESIFRFVSMCGAKSSEKGLPIWPIPLFINHSVKPDRGLYSDNYYYSVDVRAEKSGTVKLSILCPDGNLLYETEQDYIEAPEWQTLNWSVQNFNGCDVKTGAARYLIEFWYKGSVIISRTEEGPYIGIAKFGNGTVEPEIGTDKTLFNYSIDVIAAHEGDVELLIKCTGGTQWDTKGEIEYDTRNKWKTLSWTGIEPPCDHCGDAEYMFRFVPGYVKSEKYTGPEIIIEEFGDPIVAPGNGTN